ncbi:two-component system, OmpR family, alkaline phosphatase synthesis response regulator PhoP [Alteribacillus persepolensis]|uniref:Two-component system, OmpR family, alkaline phosphatase synthesis response regulator PhoP n=1 Tax=Alteribacillus persepolensis TaxID=568899 RepID=A0A1G7Z6S0_9BACI|nr:response regulator transcription factor [Alteribacillus persepolensis]SDH04299.1 two-component system, OmpR family, alkaline phosphatase synthesis response regulator PhoP [Alteribacillus persepolensis]
MGKKSVLIVEDEEDIRNLLHMYLETEYHVLVSDSGNEALSLMRQHRPDIIILDILLPEIDGLDVCRIWREEDEDTPILFLSAKKEYEDKIYGLELGADDYITKPFDPREVMARVKAHLRRTQRSLKSKQSGDTNKYLLSFGDVSIDVKSYTVTLKNEPIHLYAKEFQLLLLFVEHPHRVFSVEHLYNTIWGRERLGDLKTVSVHIRNLRKKLEKNPAKPVHIVTVRGFGYKFIP